MAMISLICIDFPIRLWARYCSNAAPGPQAQRLQNLIAPLTEAISEQGRELDADEGSVGSRFFKDDPMALNATQLERVAVAI